MHPNAAPPPGAVVATAAASDVGGSCPPAIQPPHASRQHTSACAPAAPSAAPSTAAASAASDPKSRLAAFKQRRRLANGNPDLLRMFSPAQVLMTTVTCLQILPYAKGGWWDSHPLVESGLTKETLVATETVANAIMCPGDWQITVSFSVELIEDDFKNDG